MNVRLLTLTAAAVLTLGACGSSGDDGTQAADTGSSSTQQTTATGTTSATGSSSPTSAPSTHTPDDHGTFVDGTIKQVQPFKGGGLNVDQCEPGDDSASTMTPCPTAEGTIVGTVLVSVPDGPQGQQVSYVFTVTADTDLTMLDSPRGSPLPFKDLMAGTSVRVTIDGPVMQSDPAQATADAIEVYMR